MRGRGFPVSSAIYRRNGVMKPPPAMRIFRVARGALVSAVIKRFNAVMATTRSARRAFTEGKCDTREPAAMACHAWQQSVRLHLLYGRHMCVIRRAGRAK